MTTYVPPKKNGSGGWIGYVSLAPQTGNGQWQSNPTLAVGDVKVSIDGGALANITTLPAVTPASSKLVKITLSQSEINGDNITIIFSDAAGAEWCDKTINLQTTARQIDDLAYPATSGRSIVVDASGLVDANTVKVGPSGSGTAQTAGDIVANETTIAGYIDTEVAAIKAKTDNLPASPAATSDIPSAATVAAAVWDVDATGHQTQGTFGQAIGDPGADTDTLFALVNTNLDTTVSSRLASASYTAPDNATITAIAGYVDTEVAAIKAVTDLLPDAGALTSIATAASITALHNLSAADVNAEVVDALNVDTYAEPGQGAPPATATLVQKIGYLYKAFRNKKTQTASTFSLFADDASTVDQKATVSDDGTTFTSGEVGTGP